MGQWVNEMLMTSKLKVKIWIELFICQRIDPLQARVYKRSHYIKTTQNTSNLHFLCMKGMCSQRFGGTIELTRN